MSELKIDPLTPDHLGAVLAMVCQDCGADLELTLGFLPSIYDLEEQTIHDPDFAADLCLGISIDGTLAGFIQGIHRPWKEGKESFGYIKTLFVQEKFRRSGVGTCLIQACEARLAARGCDTLIYGSCSPFYIFPGVPAGDHGLIALLESAGWRRSTDRVSLNVDLGPYRAKGRLSVSARGEKIRIADGADKDRVSAFVEREFSLSWVRESESTFEPSDHSFCLIMEDREGREIIGFAAIGATNRNWFGPMGIGARFRRLGLGRVLFENALKKAHERGLTRLVLPWVNDKESFYTSIVGKADRQVFHKFTKKMPGSC